MLVLSLFPGIGLLDKAFELEGFCVVRGPDVLWGGDVREFHPPVGKFDGVIGGPPCQAFSRLAHMVRHNGFEPQFGNLIPEYERVIDETGPQWFIMENVPDAPTPAVAGYGVHSFTLNNRQCIDDVGDPAVQNRVRRWSFGWRGERRVLMVETAALHSRDWAHAALGGGAVAFVDGKIVRNQPAVKIGGSGKLKPCRRLNEAVGDNIKSKSALARLVRLQGLPEDFTKHMPFTVTAACKAIGNGVPLPMGRAIAKAVLEITKESDHANSNQSD